MVQELSELNSKDDNFVMIKLATIKSLYQLDPNLSYSKFKIF